MPLPRIPRPSRPLAAVGIITAAYLVSFAVLYPLLGAGVSALSLVPVVAAGWCWGARAGGLAAVALFGANTALLNAADPRPLGWGAVLVVGGGPGVVASVAAGVAAGWVRRDRDRVRAQLDRLLRAEVALRASEARLNHAQRIARLGSWELDLSTGRLWWSDQVYDLFGVDPATPFTPTREAFRNMVHPDDRPRLAAAVEGALDRGETYDIDHRVVLPGGGERVVNEHAEVVRDEAGRPVRLVGTVLDVTDRLRAEAALREREGLLRTVIAHIPSAVFWKDRDSVFLGCNQRFAEDHGLAGPDQVVGRTDRDLAIDPAEAEADLADDRKVIETEEPQLNREQTRTRPGGDKVALLASKVPLRGAAGAVVGVLGVYRDVTGRKRLEAQYQQAQKMEAFGRLAGGVAHDFNNLLTVINGYGDIILDKLPAGDPTRGMVREIKTAGERAASLTRQLLAFSRQQVVAPRVLDLNATLKGTEMMLRRLIGEDVALVAALDPALGLVTADPGQVEQVLMNLAVNARDAMPRGGKLTIKTRNVEFDGSRPTSCLPPDVRPGPYVLLAVADTGGGMDEATRARVFEPFFTTKGNQGTGLGLATVYGIVTQAGGHVEVDTAPGQGTTFRVYLPRSGASAPTGKSHPGVSIAPRGSETLLLVEDEDGVRALARRVLQALGYRVLEASLPGEAVHICERFEGPIHLLVTDVVMPKMGGRELADHLTAVRPDLKVLFLSGYTDELIVRHGVLREESEFLHKPFKPAELARKIREVLDKPVPAVMPW